MLENIFFETHTDVCSNEMNRKYFQENKNSVSFQIHFNLINRGKITFCVWLTLLLEFAIEILTGPLIF